jgi:peptidoglycan/xylan/chitin deacetylase (PgdA/CDA1 family)
METLIFWSLVAEVKEAKCRKKGELTTEKAPISTVTLRSFPKINTGGREKESQLVFQKNRGFLPFSPSPVEFLGTAAVRHHLFSELTRVALAAAVLAACVLSAGRVVSGQASAPTRDTSLRVSVLVYHRFAPVVKDSMTVRTSTFRWQLDYLKQHQQPVITLRALVSYLEGKGAPPPPRAVVITADDGHESVFTDMLPAIREYQVPVTLFIYPSAISNASYAMTWQQLVALRETRLFDIQSHTYWHPNFKTEKRRLSADAFRAFAANQLVKPRMVLEKRLGIRPDVLAWPFGIYDDELLAMAREAGYDAAFTIDGRAVTSREQIMALPRFLMTDKATGSTFAAMVGSGK